MANCFFAYVSNYTSKVNLPINMKKFMDENFLLMSPTAQKLYHNYCKNIPIIDYHCHINPKEIAENKRFKNITEIWLSGDHYKWRLMRSAGVSEEFITGDANDKEKFIKWATVIGNSIGNPLYHWSHLELQRYFGYYGGLNKSTAEHVWNLCNEKLNEQNMTAREFVKISNVTHICTTDDPIDSLEWHEKIAADTTFNVVVLPTWRPDKAMNLDKTNYLEYIQQLSNISNTPINSFDDLMKSLTFRMDYFQKLGCVSSDHGMEFVYFNPNIHIDTPCINDIFQKRLKKIPLTFEEIFQFKSAFMLFMGRQCHSRNWVMQLHYGCKRDNNSQMFEKLGADTGFDCVSNYTPSDLTTNFLNALNSSGNLPKTVIYSLNAQDNAAIDSIIGCFQDNTAVGKIQHGSAWWFNDHKLGMLNHLTSIANIGYLSGFIGMLTDSRSFLSYPRHEYFRRILCNLIGQWIEDGEVLYDEQILESIVKNISYYNAMRYFFK